MGKSTFYEVLIVFLILGMLMLVGCGNASAGLGDTNASTTNSGYFEAEYVIDEDTIQTNNYITRLIFYEDGNCWLSSLSISDYFGESTSSAIQKYSVGKKTKTIAIGTAGISGGILFSYSDDFQTIETEGYSLHRVK